MVGYMSLEEQVDADFSRAFRRAFLQRILARLRKDPSFNHLPCFEEVMRKVGAAGGVRLGQRTVRLTDIVGSVSRCSEFDPAFLPLRESVRTKWERIDRAFHRGEELPPVELYMIDEEYFVNDGNHRVSVARCQGVEFIDAYVTEFRARSDTPPPLVPTRPRTIEETKEHTFPNKPLGRERPKKLENELPAEGIKVRRGAVRRLGSDRGGCSPCWESPPSRSFVPSAEGSDGWTGQVIEAGMTKSSVRLPEDRKGRDIPRSHPRGGPKMYPMDPRLLKQMHEQMVREAQRKALPRELRAARKRRASWASALAWELKRAVSRLLKLLRSLKTAD